MVKKCDYLAFLSTFKVLFSSLHNPNHDPAVVIVFDCHQTCNQRYNIALYGDSSSQYNSN